MIIIVMGVSGSGKTTIGSRLAAALQWKFVDADEFHPAANLQKMRQGHPLTEDDRRPWLAALKAHIGEWLADDRNVVLACSALKRWYRRELLLDPSRMRIVYLKGSFDLIARRLRRRRGHFVGPELLASQFDALEEPEGALIIDAASRPGDIVQRIKMELML